MKYVIGIDYGTDSARAVAVDATTGAEAACAVKHYPRWSAGRYCDPARNRYRQHPLDYIEALEHIVRSLPEQVRERVVGLSFDTTGSTPVLTDAQGTPLALTPGFEEEPDAMFVLWKDHTAIAEADEINAFARRSSIDYTRYEGGIYSSEWVWAKVLHLLRSNERVRAAAHSWIEHCDWMSALITGTTAPASVKRSRCAAGHKAMWHPAWGGLPPVDFLAALDPALAAMRANLYTETFTSDTPAGRLTAEWSERLGLKESVVVGVSAFDCHMGAVGGQITPGVLARAIGTSTCDILIAPSEAIGDRTVKGICGQVDGSVIPGYVGLEAGQSGFGDIYAWFKSLLSWPMRHFGIEGDIENKIIPALSEEAAKIPIEESTIIATDWLNGRRTPDANQGVTGTIAGLTLGSSAPRIFRALVEATACGSRAIAERFRREGIDIEGVIGLGGVAKKSPFVMQTMADVMHMPIRVASSEQTCACGAAMFAAVAAGLYPRVEDAQRAMGQGFEREYTPDPANAKKYDELYAKYLKLGHFTEYDL